MVLSHLLGGGASTMNKDYVSTWFMCQEEMAVRVERKDTESGSLERIYDCTLAQELVLARIS